MKVKKYFWIALVLVISIGCDGSNSRSEKKSGTSESLENSSVGDVASLPLPNPNQIPDPTEIPEPSEAPEPEASTIPTTEPIQTPAPEPSQPASPQPIQSLEPIQTTVPEPTPSEVASPTPTQAPQPEPSEVASPMPKPPVPSQLADDLILSTSVIGTGIWVNDFAICDPSFLAKLNSVRGALDQPENADHCVWFNAEDFDPKLTEWTSGRNPDPRFDNYIISKPLAGISFEVKRSSPKAYVKSLAFGALDIVREEVELSPTIVRLGGPRSSILEIDVSAIMPKIEIIEWVKIEAKGKINSELDKKSALELAVHDKSRMVKPFTQWRFESIASKSANLNMPVSRIKIVETDGQITEIRSVRARVLRRVGVAPADLEGKVATTPQGTPIREFPAQCIGGRICGNSSVVSLKLPGEKGQYVTKLEMRVNDHYGDRKKGRLQLLADGQRLGGLVHVDHGNGKHVSIRVNRMVKELRLVPISADGGVDEVRVRDIKVHLIE